MDNEVHAKENDRQRRYRKGLGYVFKRLWQGLNYLKRRFAVCLFYGLDIVSVVEKVQVG